MDYKKIYKKLCSSRKYRGLGKEFGYEIHHVKPRCMGGNDDISNLVKLTIREHCLAHKLLTKFVKGAHKYKLLTAYKMMYSIHNNSKEVEAAKKQIGLWEGKFLVIPRYVDQEPMDYFQTLNYYGFDQILLPIGSKEYYNNDTLFTYNRVRYLISKYELPYNSKSLIFTEVNIAVLGSKKNLKLKELCQGFEINSRASIKAIPCNTEYIGRFNNPIRYKDIVKIKENLPKEVSNESNYSYEEYCFYMTVKELTLDYNNESLKIKYSNIFKCVLNLKRVSPKYFIYTSNILKHLSEHKAVRLPRKNRCEVFDMCANMLLSTGNIKVKKGCKYHGDGAWLDDILIVSNDSGDEGFYVKAKREYGDVRFIFKSMCSDMGLFDIF